jgi:hypothetical protein
MLALERLAQTGDRPRPTRTRISEHAPSVRSPGTQSHVQRPRTEDLGASRPAHASPCRHELPARLARSSPLPDPAHSTGGSCSHDQARRLIVWNNHRPTHQQTSFSCERLTPTEPTPGR